MTVKLALEQVSLSDKIVVALAWAKNKTLDYFFCPSK